MILQNASDEVEEKKDEEIERLNTNLEVANEDLTRIAQLLNLEEGCTIHDIEDKIERLNNIINELEKYLEKITDRVIMYGIYDDTYKTTNLYRDIKNKIKKLKGSDKKVKQGIYMCDEEGNEWVDKKTYNSLYEEYEKANNIIKEVREYIINHQLVFEISSKKQIAYWFDMFYKEVLEILDKVDKENNNDTK